MPTPDPAPRDLVRGPHFVNIPGTIDVPARALYVERESWYGSVRPWFTYTDVELLVMSLPDSLRVTEGDEVLYDDQQGDGWQPVPRTTFDGDVIYGVGTGWWTWSDALKEVLPPRDRPEDGTRAAADFSAEIALRTSGCRDDDTAGDSMEDHFSLALLLANLHWWAESHRVDFEAALVDSKSTIFEDQGRWGSLAP